jgi:DNA-binding transcriptional LysR family regulator
MSLPDLNLLRVLDAMFTQRTVTGAAQALGLTQPGMSLALRRLRDHFGDPLFVRNGSVMAPTALAERLREPVARTLATIRAEIVPATPFDPAMSERCFAIGLSDLGDLVFLPDLVARLRAIAPSVSIRSMTVSPAALLHGLADGTIDLAIGHLTDVDTDTCLEQTLFAQPLMCLVRADHPQIGDHLSIDQFLAADHIVVTQTGGSQQVFEDRVRQLGYARRIVLRSPHFMSVPFLVAQSDMLTVVPLAVGRIYAGLLRLKMLPLPFDLAAVDLKQFWHRRAHTDPEILWLRRMVAAVFVGRDPTQSADSAFWSSLAGRDPPAQKAPPL